MFESFDDNRLAKQLSGNRFTVTYLIKGTQRDAEEKAEVICLEQTVELPFHLLPPGHIPGAVIGRIDSVEKIEDNTHRFVISYAVEVAADEISQLYNVIFGNISILPGITVERFDLHDSMYACFSGPRFGISGLREILDEPESPLLFTALKPMGLSADDLAQSAYQLALGGIHIIKDDHGLSNQVFATFEERVQKCSAAVAKANAETGFKSIYIPSIMGDGCKTLERARFAKENGAGGLLVIPALVGFGMMHQLSIDNDIALPIFCHPSFLGSFIINSNGVTCACMLGQFARLAGADGTVFPNYSGRFSLSEEQCVSIQRAGSQPMGSLKKTIACPAGGMSAKSLPQSLKVYGNDVALLMGGGLFNLGPDLTANSREFAKYAGITK